MLGDQAALRKGRGEDRRVGGDADVGIEREHHAEPGARAVDRPDDRLRHRREIGILLLEIRGGVRVEGGRLGPRGPRLGAVARLDTGQGVHVGPGAKAAAGARQHDHPHLIVIARRPHGQPHVPVHLAAPGVQPVGPVEGDEGDAVLDAIENVFVGHDRFLVTCFSCPANLRPRNRKGNSHERTPL